MFHYLLKQGILLTLKEPIDKHITGANHNTVDNVSITHPNVGTLWEVLNFKVPKDTIRDYIIAEWETVDD